ncbi:uncharacterized protein LOC123545118 [Mercenaria mercenaria]|uniref:uncharacterized protein LOC123545118 n=1 Tax=Mercenaria mercenaria TaxID=6596 RepID=UPI00234EFDB6|nr:uncharacterized protein LOC123545118 [Mercenaria mercenaria]
MEQPLVKQSRKERVDYKKLNEGSALPKHIQKCRTSIKPKVLPQTYTVERIICRKKSPDGERFLVKWEGYHPQESTWEPASHISDELVGSYMCPSVCRTRLEAAALTFESTIQQCLSTKANTVSALFPLDIYRYVFGTDKSVVITSATEIEKLPLRKNWTYKINSSGCGVMVLFPFRLTPRCFMRPVYVRSDTTISRMTMPVEKLTIICPAEPTIPL